MRALIVDDSPEIVDAIALCLKIRWPDTTLSTTARGSRVMEMIEADPPNIVLLDLGLADMDGLDVLKEIRRYSDVPVIIVTVRGEEMARVKGLEMGADDYVVKPFSHTELLARVKAVLRRTQWPELWNDEALIHGPGFTIDLAGRRVLRDGEEIGLSATEWRLLSYFVRNQGRVITWPMLAQRVWGSEFVTQSAIKMCIRRVRLKLGDDTSNPSIIVSHRGHGYSFTHLH